MPNRIALPSMGRSVCEEGAPSPEVGDYYARRAIGGAGLIMTEGVFIDHPVAGDNSMLGRFYGHALEAWADVARKVHAAGGVTMPQLWHVGLKYSVHDMNTGQPVFRPELGLIGPSGYIERDKQVTEPMTQQQIDEVIESFGRGADSAMAMGFDGIEIHGAHGYLVDQFLWADTNHRTDRYGGSARARAQFGAEIVAECRRRLGTDVPIHFRMSNWKLVDYDARLTQTPQELEELLAPLVDAGVDLFDCSERRFWQPLFEGSDLNLAGWTKKVTGKPTMTTGSIGLDIDLMTGVVEGREANQDLATFTRLLEMFYRGDFDLIGVGRSQVAEPDWANLVRQGEFDKLKPFSYALIDNRRAEDDASGSVSKAAQG